MKLSTKDLTLGALGSAISLLFLLFSSVSPTGKLALGFIAATVPCVLCVECAFNRTSLISGISTSILAALLLPKSGLAGVVIMLYCVCFSYYPVLKAVIEQRKNLILEWTLKLIYFFAVAFILKLTAEKIGLPLINIVVIAAALAAYDLLLSFVIGYYMQVISPRINKSKMS